MRAFSACACPLGASLNVSGFCAAPPVLTFFAASGVGTALAGGALHLDAIATAAAGGVSVWSRPAAGASAALYVWLDATRLEWSAAPAPPGAAPGGPRLAYLPASALDTAAVLAALLPAFSELAAVGERALDEAFPDPSPAWAGMPAGPLRTFRGAVPVGAQPWRVFTGYSSRFVVASPGVVGAVNLSSTSPSTLAVAVGVCCALITLAVGISIVVVRRRRTLAAPLRAAPKLIQQQQQQQPRTLFAALHGNRRLSGRSLEVPVQPPMAPQAVGDVLQSEGGADSLQTWMANPAASQSRAAIAQSQGQGRSDSFRMRIGLDPRLVLRSLFPRKERFLAKSGATAAVGYAPTSSTPPVNYYIPPPL